MLGLWQWLFGLWSMASSALLGSLPHLGEPPQITRSTLSSECEGCHPAQVEDWRQSRHALAFTNGLFRFEFEGRRTAWCASCHAPSAEDPRTVADSDPVALEGVGCVACHLDAEGALISKTRAASSPHPTVAREDFGSASFCAGCHEFNFPIMGKDGMPTGFQPLAMQETVSQFRQTPFAAAGGECTDCHMAGSPGRHLFPGSHTPATLRSALAIEHCRAGSVLQISIGNLGAAHSVPTGGVNRHMVLRAWRSSDPDKLREFFIGRRFAGSESGKRLLEDTSLAAGETREFALGLLGLGGDASAAINIELRYIYPLEEFAELASGTRRYEVVSRDRMEPDAIPTCDKI